MAIQPDECAQGETPVRDNYDLSALFDDFECWREMYPWAKRLDLKSALRAHHDFVTIIRAIGKP